ncbi:MAG: hypothetical protein WA108_16090, partial [Thiobacillus sp.]
AGRGQILTILQGNSRSIAQKSGEIWTGQANLQPISFKSDRLLAVVLSPGNPQPFILVHSVVHPRHRRDLRHATYRVSTEPTT